MPDFVGYEATISSSDGELLRHARERLRAAKEFRRRTREEVWRQNELQYEGKQWPKDAYGDPAADLITVNMSFSTVNTILPFITAEEPRFLVEPYSTDAKLSNARLQQTWLNRFWRSRASGAQGALEDATTDALIYGDGTLKVTFQFRDKATSPDTTAEVADILIDRVSPWDFWIDPNATRLNKARYVIHRYYNTRGEMEADEERYGDVNLDELPWGNVAFEDASSEFKQEERLLGEQDWMEIYEFYDTVRKVSLTFVDADDSPLISKVEGTEPPFAQINNYFLPRSPYHMSELEQIKSLQDELNKSRSELATHRRRNIAKYFVRKDMLTQDAIDAMQSPIVGQGIPIDTDIPLNEVIYPVTIAPLPSEAYASADQAVRDVYEITGVSEYLRGAAPEIRRTATEASIIEGASNVKVQAKLRKVEVCAREVGTIVLAVAKAVFPLTDIDEMGLFVTGDEAQRAVRAKAGEDMAALMEDPSASSTDALAQLPDLSLQQDIELRPTEEMFEGEYEVFVETASTELRNPLFKEQKFREMAEQLTAVAPALAQMGVTLNLRKIYERWFDAAGISDIEGMFDSQPAAAPMMPQGPGGPGVPQPMQQPGAPNLSAAMPPMDGITPDNSGAFPPTA